MQETERKFFVTSNEYVAESFSHTVIAQGYLNSDPKRTVRVRIKGEKGFLTIKGKGNASGMTRFEWEKEIPPQEATALLALCEEGKIEKVRYDVRVGDHIFEVDVFSGENDGLIIAEIELNTEDEPFEKPRWLGKEVTGDARFYNASLSRNPYKNWKPD
ncbi:MAG TPA: CYTH domain-containing protein [Flavobacterium sp.]|jgi:CYTH domain-containing protein